MAFGLWGPKTAKSEGVGLLSVQSVSKICNLCDHNPPINVTDRQKDRRRDRRHAISIQHYAHYAVKTYKVQIGEIFWRLETRVLRLETRYSVKSKPLVASVPCLARLERLRYDGTVTIVWERCLGKNLSRRECLSLIHI